MRCSACAPCQGWHPSGRYLLTARRAAYANAASASARLCAQNCFITTKIAFANAIADVADRTPGADRHTILDAIGSDARVGSRCLRPGYGFGGPCFPRDNRAFALVARAVGAPALICDATDAANQQHARLMADALLAEGRSTYTIEDVAFRPGCPADIIEESQPLEVAKLLVRAGKSVIVRDRPAIIALVRRTYGKLFQYDTYSDDAGARAAEGRGNAAGAPVECEGARSNAHAAEAPAALHKRKRDEPLITMGNPSSSYRR